MTAIITEFADGLPIEVQKMTTALEQKDMAALRLIIHQLRGCGYGFTPITETAHNIEQLIDASDNIESVTAQVNALIEVICRIEGYDKKKTQTNSQPAVQ